MGSVFNGGMRKPQPRPKFRPTFIKQWREHRQLNQEQLADKLGMTQSHLSMLENGRRGYTQETLEAVAHALQTDTGSLLTRNPMADGDAIWPIWNSAGPNEKRMIVDIAKTLTKSNN
jgi:transcriptional regulator with XRE-family HTH domain